MSQSKHTPGPWFTYHQNDHHEWQIGAGLPPEKANNDGHYEFIVGETFGGLGDDDSESDANARLIAAAPDMMEALKTAKELVDVMEGLCSGRSDDEWVWAAQEKINAAISKAQGGAS